MVDSERKLFLNKYETNGTLISSKLLIQGSTVINDIIPYNDYYILTGCNGYYDTILQQQMPMLMIQLLVDNEGQLIHKIE